MMKINEYTPIGKIAVIGNFLYTEMTQRKGSSVTTAPFPPDFNIDKQCELIYHIWNNCYSIMKEGKKELILISNGCDVTYIERSFKNFSAIIKTRYRQTVIKGFETINTVLHKDQFENLKQKVKDIHIDDELSKYILKIIFATREPENYGLEDIAQYIDFGASPRGSIDLYKACKAYAFLDTKEFVTPYDVAKVAFLVLRHRIVLNYNAVADDVTADDIIQKILEKIPTP